LLTTRLERSPTQRAWIDQQKAQEPKQLTWPEHIYEKFIIVVSIGLYELFTTSMNKLFPATAL
jgi:hypothetical protein